MQKMNIPKLEIEFAVRALCLMSGYEAISASSAEDKSMTEHGGRRHYIVMPDELFAEVLKLSEELNKEKEVLT